MCTIDGCGPPPNLPPLTLSDAQRRAFLAGSLSLPLATVLGFPELAGAQADTLSPISFPVPGGFEAKGFIAWPKPSGTPAPAIVLIHEWWGLNDQIKAVAAEFAALGFIAFAIDLYEGEVTTSPGEARALTRSVVPNAAIARIEAAISGLRRMDGANGKVGVVGWCFGGGWAINTAMATSVDASVIYYGNVDRTAEDLSYIKGPVLGHFGTLDQHINVEMVRKLEANMKAAGKDDLLTVYWYEADHAFANPTGARHDAEDAALAWRRTLGFLEQNLSAEG